MVPSIFYGHNKQQSKKIRFCFPPVPGERKGCCPEQHHHEEVGSCRVGTALLPARSQGGGSCCTCQSSRAGSAFLPLPCPDLPQLQCQHTPLSCCSVQRLLYRMRLVQNGKNGLGQEGQSTAQPPPALRKQNLSFLP